MREEKRGRLATVERLSLRRPAVHGGFGVAEKARGILVGSRIESATGSYQGGARRRRRAAMQASAWRDGAGHYGIRVGVPNRNQHFHRGWAFIEVEIDGRVCRFALPPAFWGKRPEIHDAEVPDIRDWLERHRCLDWLGGQPPRLELVPLGGNRFRLVG